MKNKKEACSPARKNLAASLLHYSLVISQYSPETHPTRLPMLTWVERYDKATVEAKHMIIAALVDRIEIGENYEVHIQFKVSAEQFIRQTA